MKHSLPWESVPPPIYPAQASLKPRKKWVQVGGWILVVVLLLFGISTRSRNPLLAFVSLAFSVLYLLTLMTKKDAALTSRGLEIYYDMQFTTNYEFYPWEDINAIVCEDRGHADMVRLHIGHGLVLLYSRDLPLFFLFRRLIFLLRFPVCRVCRFLHGRGRLCRPLRLLCQRRRWQQRQAQGQRHETAQDTLLHRSPPVRFLLCPNQSPTDRDLPVGSSPYGSGGAPGQFFSFRRSV